MEAYNKSLKSALRQSYQQKELIKKWDLKTVIKTLVFKYNHERQHSSTKFKPVELLIQYISSCRV